MEEALLINTVDNIDSRVGIGHVGACGLLDKNEALLFRWDMHIEYWL